MAHQAIEVIARAVIRLEGQLLVARCQGASNTFLPGGHVASGERMHDALQRELNEELGEYAEVGAYLGAIEHSYTQAGVSVHEINHLFCVELPGVTRIRSLRSRESHLEFFWHPLDSIAAINLAPAPAVELINSRRSSPHWASTMRGAEDIGST